MQIDMLEVVNTMPVTKEEKESAILTMIDADSKDWTFIYEGDKIKHIQYNGVVQRKVLTINIGEE